MQGFTQWDLATYPGLAFGVVAIIGSLKKLFPAWTDGKEPHLGLILSYALGISAKLFVPGAFAAVHWVVYLASLVLVAAGAKFGHDHILNEIVKPRAGAKKGGEEEKK